MDSGQPLRGFRNDGGNSDARLRGRLRQQAQPQILRHVGILIFIHQNEFEAFWYCRSTSDVRETAGCFPTADRRNRRVENLQPLLIERVELAALPLPNTAASPAAPATASARDSSSRRLIGEHPRGQRLSSMLSAARAVQQANLIVDIEHGEMDFSSTSSAWLRRMRPPIE